MLKVFAPRTSSARSRSSSCCSIAWHAHARSSSFARSRKLMWPRWYRSSPSACNLPAISVPLRDAPPDCGRCVHASSSMHHPANDPNLTGASGIIAVPYDGGDCMRHSVPFVSSALAGNAMPGVAASVGGDRHFWRGFTGNRSSSMCGALVAQDRHGGVRWQSNHRNSLPHQGFQQVASECPARRIPRSPAASAAACALQPR